MIAFCGQFPEGVRVEYKSQVAQVEKIVASLPEPLLIGKSEVENLR